MTDDRDRIATALLALRLGVFIVMLVWTLEKFVNPGHAAAVFENLYGLADVAAWPMLAACIALYLLRISTRVSPSRDEPAGWCVACSRRDRTARQRRRPARHRPHQRACAADVAHGTAEGHAAHVRLE
jgi:hypothetical protein